MSINDESSTIGTKQRFNLKKPLLEMDVYICDGLGNFSGGENPAGDKAVSVPDTSLSIIDSQSTPSDIPPTR